MQKYRIANIILQSNHEIDDLEIYRSDDVFGESEISFEVIFDQLEADYFHEPLIYGKDIYWTYNNKNQICITIFNKTQDAIIGNMTISSDYKNAVVSHRFLDGNFLNDAISIFMQIFVQIALTNFSGLMLHASAVQYGDKAIVFSGPSGTGKSTQARLWNEYIGTRYINADRPALTLQDNQLWVSGLPWSGSERIYTTISCPVACIVVLEQSKDNTLEVLTPGLAVSRLLPRVFLPYNDEILSKRVIAIFDAMLHSIPIYHLRCRPDNSAVSLLKTEIDRLSTLTF